MWVLDAWHGKAKRDVFAGLQPMGMIGRFHLWGRNDLRILDARRLGWLIVLGKAESDSHDFDGMERRQWEWVDDFDKAVNRMSEMLAEEEYRLLEEESLSDVPDERLPYRIRLAETMLDDSEKLGWNDLEMLAENRLADARHEREVGLRKPLLRLQMLTVAVASADIGQFILALLDQDDRRNIVISLLLTGVLCIVALEWVRRTFPKER